MIIITILLLLLVVVVVAVVVVVVAVVIDIVLAGLARGAVRARASHSTQPRASALRHALALGVLRSPIT